MKLIIYGAGTCGRYVYSKICGNVTVEMPLWIDNTLDGQIIANRPVLSEEKFIDRNEKDAIIIVAIMSDTIRQKICLSLNKNGYSEVYLLDWHCVFAELPILNENDDFQPWVKRFDKIKPVLPYLEYQVSDKCNLNCASCAHFSNLYTENEFPDPELFRKDLMVLSERFSNIEKIRLMGGEPLLNERLPEFIEISRDVFPRSDIRVVTNGLLLLSISESLRDVMQRSVAMFDISQYPIIENRISEIMDCLSSLKIGYQLEPLTNQFWIRTTTGTNIPEKAFMGKACSKTCTFLRNGRLFDCPQIPLLYEMKKYFGFNISEDEYWESSLKLSEDMLEDGWDILNYLSTPKKMCRFCSYDFEWTDWSCGITHFDKTNYLVRGELND